MDKITRIKSEIERLYRESYDNAPTVLHQLMDFINSLPEEPVNEELEEAASSFARKDSKGISNPANFYYIVADKMRIFKAGAKWQKEQMKKDVVECDIEGTIIGTDGNFGLARIKGDYNYGDKVKLIIVKED